MQDMETVTSREELKELIREQCGPGMLVRVSFMPEGGDADGEEDGSGFL